MNHHSVRKAALGLIALLILLSAGLAWAGSSANYTVDWQVICGAGAPSASGAVTLNGSLGQTAIGPSAAGDSDLRAGFWYGAYAPLAPECFSYIPLILKNF